MDKGYQIRKKKTDVNPMGRKWVEGGIGEGKEQGLKGKYEIWKWEVIQKRRKQQGDQGGGKW